MALRDRDAGTSTHPRSLSVAALRCWLHTIDVSFWHGYAQAEGVANLDKVPETGALVIVGYPKFGGGLVAMRVMSAVARLALSDRPAGCAVAEIRKAFALRRCGRHAHSVTLTESCGSDCSPSVEVRIAGRPNSADVR